MKRLFVFQIILLVSNVAIAQYTAIPDTNFEQTLINQGIDTEGTLDGQVLTSDINTLTSLDVSYLYEISDLTGIEDFTNLETLNCTYNELYELDISNNTKLTVLKCENNWLTTLDISNNLFLEELHCGNPVSDVGPLNGIAALDLSNNSILKVLSCPHIPITDLDVSDNPMLEFINVIFCNLSDVDLSNNLALRVVSLGDYYLEPGSLVSNNFQSVDLSTNQLLETVYVRNMDIEDLNLKNAANNIMLSVYADENPNLVCITVDDEDAANAGDYPYSEWHVDPGVFYSENCVIGIDDFDEGQIAIYPNPFTDVLYIENTTETLDKIEVLDILGEKLITKKKDFSQIDFSNNSAGVYFVKFYAGDTVLTKKVVKK